MVVLGLRARIARMTRAKCSAPPSARSSRSTEVMTTCASPSFSTASRDVVRLVRVERAGQSGAHVAEGAGARAGVAHDHEGGVRLGPAFADVGAAGFLAHGVQAVLAHDGARLHVFAAGRRLDADPVGLAQHRRVRPRRLFRMAQRRGAAWPPDRKRYSSAAYIGSVCSARRRRPVRKRRPMASGGGGGAFSRASSPAAAR